MVRFLSLVPVNFWHAKKFTSIIFAYEVIIGINFAGEINTTNPIADENFTGTFFAREIISAMCLQIY